MVLNAVVAWTCLISRGREFQTEGSSRKKREVSWHNTAKLNPPRLNVAVPMHKDTHSMWGGCEVWLHISVEASCDITSALPCQWNRLLVITCVMFYPGRTPPNCHHPQRQKHRCHFGECPPCSQVCDLRLPSCQHSCPMRCHDAVKVKVEDKVSWSLLWFWNLFFFVDLCIYCVALSQLFGQYLRFSFFFFFCSSSTLPPPFPLPPIPHPQLLLFFFFFFFFLGGGGGW